MHSQLRERIRLMRARLDNAAPVAEIRAESQLFVTPAPVCDRLVTLAESKRLVRTVLIFTESSDQLSRATDRVPGLPASPGYVQ